MTNTKAVITRDLDCGIPANPGGTGIWDVTDRSYLLS